MRPRLSVSYLEVGDVNLPGHGLENDDGLELLQRPRYLPRLLRARVSPPVIPHAIIGEEQHRLDLHQPVQNRRHARVGAHGRPDGSEVRGGQHGDDGVGVVAQEPGDAIAGLDS
jgi:hypothetical protein